MSAATFWRTAPAQREGRCRLVAALVALLAAALVGVMALCPGVARADDKVQVAHAEDGSAVYYSIDDAWSAGRYEGKVIVMDTDWVRTAALGVPSNQSIILKMNGHKITRASGEVSDGSVFWLYDNSSLTLDGTTTDEDGNTVNIAADLQYTAYTGSTATAINTVTTGGLVTGGHSNNSGGGVEMREGSTLTLKNVVIAGNKTYSTKGGGVSMDGAGCKLVMVDSSIEYNCTQSNATGWGGDGGGVMVYKSECSIDMTSSYISRNVAEEGSGIYSDATKTYIYMKGASGIDDNIDVGSSARYGGAGIYFNSDYYMIVGDGTASISRNKSPNHGGAIATASGSKGGSISGVTFDSNESSKEGGAIYANGSNTTIKNCVFKGNKSSGNGGALYLNGSDSTVEKCTFTDNSTTGDGSYGGAIYNNSKNDTLKSCTITNNTAKKEGGGVYSESNDDIYLSGLLYIYNNHRTDGASDDLFLDHESYYAYGMGNVDAGSWIGIRTGESGKRAVVKNLTNYIPGTFFIDNPSGFHLEYNSGENILYQQANKVDYWVYVNGVKTASYEQGATVTVDGRTLCEESQAFWCWDDKNTSGLPGLESLTDITLGDYTVPTLKFTMPGNDVILTFKTVTRLDEVSLSLSAPDPGSDLPETADLTYYLDGLRRTAQVPVTWYKVTGNAREKVTGAAEFYTTYVAQIDAAQNSEAGLAYALDMSKDKATLYLGASTQSATDTVSVDSQTGTLTVTSTKYTTRQKEITSIADISDVTVKGGQTVDDLKALLPTTVTATLEDGSEADLTLSVQANAERTWKATGLLTQDEKVMEPSNSETSAERVVYLDVTVPDYVNQTSEYATVAVTVMVKHADRTVTVDRGDGTKATTDTVEWGATLEKLEDPVWVGHVFQGWYADDSETPYVFGTPVTEDITLTAEWKLEVYDVVFEANGGEPATQLQRVEWSKTAVLPTQPTLDHYTFDGWYTEDDVEWGFDTAITSGLTLIAKWSPAIYQVTFDPANDEESKVVDVAYNTLVEKPSDPEMDGFEFLGWYTDDGEKWDFRDTVTGTMTLTANWKAIVPMVRFDGNGGKPAMQAEDVAWGTCVSEPMEPILANKVFLGWFAEGSDEAFTFDTPVKSDLHLYAHWGDITYTVTYDPANGEDAFTDSVKSGEAAKAPATPTLEGYTFLGWYTADGKQWDFNTAVTDNVTLTAKWQIKTFTVRFYGNGGKPTMQSADAEWNTYVDEPDEPVLANKVFLGWFAEGSDAAFTFDTPVKSDLKLYAHWGVITYKVTFDPANGEDATTCEVESGTTVSKPATPELEGYDFQGWYTDDGQKWNFNTQVTSNVDLTAQWKIKTFTVRFYGNGGKPSMQLAEDVEWNTYVAEPDEPVLANKAFMGWYEQGSDEAFTFDTPIKSDLKLYARWATVTYRVTFDPANGEDATTCEVESGTTVAKPATPELEGHDFVGWFTADGVEWSFDTPVTSNVTLTAAWNVQVYALRFYGNGGQPEIQVQDVEWSSCATEPFHPTKDHYDFAGWYAEGSDEAWDFDTAITSPMTFSAHWTPSTYTVTFDPDNGEDAFTYDVTYGDILGNPGDPSQWGFEFLGWFTDDGEKWDFDSLVEEDMTLTAHWTESDVITFVDVPTGTWYHDWVSEAAAYGLMTGYRDGVGAYTHLFGPQDYLRRGQVAVVLWRIAGYPMVQDGGDFPDVDTDMYYSKAVSWCVSQGIITGYQSGSKAGLFCPENPVSREELAVMVYRFARYMGVDTYKAPTDAYDACLDTASVSTWSHDAMVWCAASGVLTGVNTDAGKLLDPQASTTRAQAAKIFVQSYLIVTGQETETYEAQSAQAAVAAQADETATFDDVVTFDAVDEAAEAQVSEQPAEAATEQPAETEEAEVAPEAVETAEATETTETAEEQADASFEDVEFDEAA